MNDFWKLLSAFKVYENEALDGYLVDPQEAVLDELTKCVKSLKIFEHTPAEAVYLDAMLDLYSNPKRLNEGYLIEGNEMFDFIYTHVSSMQDAVSGLEADTEILAADTKMGELPETVFVEAMLGGSVLESESIYASREEGLTFYELREEAFRNTNIDVFGWQPNIVNPIIRAGSGKKKEYWHSNISGLLNFVTEPLPTIGRDPYQALMSIRNIGDEKATTVVDTLEQYGLL
ncbi:hypothetical protein HN789_06035 [archaeon]|jgi:hypothetical protein|nr:hypothetical protein [archaeon]MBT4273207.1 hypothetical protein [archaeon]MBT4461350.1 hypothetical protein [archaeon]MBT4858906.1 hypothetical protein [archaeon]MBT5423781.1 hypothetical protein [archaeon]